MAEMTNFDELIRDLANAAEDESYSKYQEAKKALTDAISSVTTERDRLQWDYDECVKQYDAQQKRACELEAKLAEAREMAQLLYKTNASANACVIFEEYRASLARKESHDTLPTS